MPYPNGLVWRHDLIINFNVCAKESVAKVKGKIMRALRQMGLVVVIGGSLLGGAALAAGPAAAQTDCDPSYPDFCLPNQGYDAYNCDDVGLNNFTVLPPDINGFDADYDGIGCESS
jgi:hypothetical protein